MKYSVAVNSHVGKTRSVNQDNFYCEHNFRKLENGNISFYATVEKDSQSIIAVFDGMGGENNGEMASLLAAEVTECYCSNNKDRYDVDELINLINLRICDEIKSQGCTMGSTCVILELINSQFRSWNVGDSRTYLFHNEIISQLSVDHTEANTFNSIFKGDSEVRPGSENILTQNLGIPEDDFIIEPYISEWVNINNGDIILLCSDGLTHMADNDSIASILKTKRSVRTKCQELVNLALEHGGLDNITVVLVEADEQ